MKSMTGFGAGSASDGKHLARCEVRAVNHRFLDISFHLPRGLGALEENLRKIVSERIFRGRVEIFATLEDFGTGARTVKLDEDLLSAYLTAIDKCAESTGPLKMDMASLLVIPNLFIAEETLEQPEEMSALLEQALAEAITGLVLMRATEGSRLQQDMVMRMLQVQSWLDDVQARCPAVVTEYRSRLTSRIAELLQSLPVDEARLAIEVAIFADKSCVAEECVRAATHIKHFLDTCDLHVPVGRKLDFLLQELNREVNTLTVKSNDSLLSQLAVNMKTELEKIREQVQNIE